MQPTRFEVPEQMREMADRSVGQAKKAVEQFLDATQKAVASAEGSTKTAREGAGDFSRQALAYLENNMTASFDLAHRLVQARTIEEITALQQEFVQRQVAAAAEQGQHLGKMMGKVAAATTKPPQGKG